MENTLAFNSFLICFNRSCEMIQIISFKFIFQVFSLGFFVFVVELQSGFFLYVILKYDGICTRRFVFRDCASDEMQPDVNVVSIKRFVRRWTF